MRDRLNPAIKLDGILATMYDPRTLHSREVLERVVEAFGDDVLETVIGRTVKFPDASVAGDADHRVRARAHAAAQAYRSWRGSWSPVAPSPEAAVEHERGPVPDEHRRRASRVSLERTSTARSTCCSTLISKHELDITEVSLSAVTDEFIAYLRELEVADEELDEASEFLVVAATLLDMKVAGLLPQGELVDAEDVALLEARDLLFARLLQYRAFKEVVGLVRAAPRGRVDRATRASVRLEEKYRRQTPELVWTLSVDDFAALAVARDDAEGDPARRARPPARAAGQHPRAGRARRRDAAAGWRAAELPRADRRRRRSPGSSWHDSCRCSSCTGTRRSSFEQLEPLGELTLRWTAEHWSDDEPRQPGSRL